MITMKSYNIFIFSLFSLPWVSFVRAALNPAQDDEMRRFFDHGPENLRNAFHQITESTVNAYFWAEVGMVHEGLEPYISGLDAAVLDGSAGAPQPNLPLGIALARVPGNHYLMRYANLTILNNLKKILASTYGTVIIPGNLLGMIDDDYLTTVWNTYERHRNQPQMRPLENYMVSIAVLFSMNSSMLHIINVNHPLHMSLGIAWLESYQAVIRLLHHELAGYMQIRNLVPYNEIFQHLHGHLARAGREPTRNLDQIRGIAYHLCNMILPMITIYGRPLRPQADFVPEENNGYTPGTEIISGLFNTEWSIQRLIGRTINDDIDNSQWLLEQLRCFEKVLATIDNRRGVWSAWMVHIRPMLIVVRSLLGTSGAGPSGAGPSGTN
jgi:hypothetical protein